MSMQRLIMSNRWLTNLFMSRIMKSSSHESRGKKYAMKVFREAVERTTAYPQFLRNNDVDPEAIRTFEDFKKLPIMDKKGYIDIFDIEEVCLDGQLYRGYTIEKSSGHSGKPYYWPRLPEEDAMFPNYLEHAFVQFFHIDERSTLAIIALSLSTWAGGEKMGQGLRQVADTGKYPFTVMTPGFNIEEILQIVQSLSSEYEQTIIIGCPSFLKTVIDNGEKRGIKWSNRNVKLGLGGEGYTEGWRDHMASKLGLDTNQDLLAISGGYGAADIGMGVGREYPVTVLISKLANSDRDLCRDLFGEVVPSNLLQYNPATHFIEEVNGELIFTVLSGIPLVRYNIHDRGSVIPFDEMMDILSNFGYDPVELLGEKRYGREQIWQLPFFFCNGRSDGTVIVMGSNIYPEHIELALSGEDINNFKIDAESDDKDHDKRLVVWIEHRDDDLTRLDIKSLETRYHDKILSKLLEVNAEFRNDYENSPDVADPIIKICVLGTGPFANDKDRIKTKHTV